MPPWKAKAFPTLQLLAIMMIGTLPSCRNLKGRESLPVFFQETALIFLK